MKTRTHYATLGLAPNATPEVISAAYKALVLKYFDELPEMAGAEGVARAAVLDEIHQAFNVLDDQSQKAVYDAELAGKDDEVIDEASAFHHSPCSTLEDCTTAPTIQEQKNSMRARVREQVKYWRVLREKRREAECRRAQEPGGDLGRSRARERSRSCDEGSMCHRHLRIRG